jgi:rhamnose utilization protein RhaD (predicted bifunctional aldolase and dehydrogenase)/NAD(P)-dependent dehydrogenase (short-subunit alcohol dehydrogenase family)
MIPYWDESDAGKFEGELGSLIYTTHLLGQDEGNGLYTGGSASVKMVAKNLSGEDEVILYVDNGLQPPAEIDARGFTALRSQSLAGLVRLESLATDQLENELACSRTLASAALPPVDTLLHAALPHKFVLFTRPDALLAVASTNNGQERLNDTYANEVLAISYAPSGLALAKACAAAFQPGSNPSLSGIFILQQGLVTFGETARQAYERLGTLVSKAEDHLKGHDAFHVQIRLVSANKKPLRQDLAALRKAVSTAAGFPLILTVNQHPAMLSLSRRNDLARLAMNGPAVARETALLKHLPMIGRDVDAYQAAARKTYDECFSEQPSSAMDFTPRIVFDPDFGLCALGRTAVEAQLAGERYLHNIDIILHADALAGYQTLAPKELFEAASTASLSLDRVRSATLDRVRSATPSDPEPTALFFGEVALVTGGASGIGKACVESLLARGAAVVSMDINPKVKDMYNRPDYLGLECNLTDEEAVIQAYETLGLTFGGLDMLVLNAGIFPAGVRIESLSLLEWQKVMHINLDSNLVVLREAYPLLKQSPKGGRVLVNASKNVLAPGAGAAAYSSSKAAVTQLARVAALEWGKDHIRVNMIHPDAIFDTGIWTEDVLKARAAHYGLTVQQYKTRNVLGVELNSHYVGELVAEMLGPLFEKITGAQIPVDGGSDRVI